MPYSFGDRFLPSSWTVARWCCVAVLCAGGCGDSTRPRAKPPATHHDAGNASDAGHRDSGVDLPDAQPPAHDAGTHAADAATHDAGNPEDAAVPSCGSERLPTDKIQGTEGLAMAPDGTLYYSQYGAVGRRRPGHDAEPAWLKLGANAGTVWGMGLDAHGTLFVASPDEGVVYHIDTHAAEPKAEVLSDQAGAANGLIVGPDGAVYTSDINGGHVYRFAVPGGGRSEVTATLIEQPNGVLFDADGTLLVLSYGPAQIIRLTLDKDMHETNRKVAGSVMADGAALDGIGRDEQGRIYVTDNGRGLLLRFDAQLKAATPLLDNVPSAANVVFGRGALDCLDLYVASGDALARFHADVTGVP